MTMRIAYASRMLRNTSRILAPALLAGLLTAWSIVWNALYFVLFCGDLPDGPRYRQWDAQRVREWAARIGDNTTTVVNRIFESVPVDEQGLDGALRARSMFPSLHSAGLSAPESLRPGSLRSPAPRHR